jgi:hypothetical protein
MNNERYKRGYQAMLLTRLGIQADSLPLSRSNLASYVYEIFVELLRFFFF